MMRKPARLAVATMLLAGASAMCAQESAPPPAASPAAQAADPSGKVDPPPPQAPPALRSLPRAILRDQKAIWLRPWRMKRGDVPWALTVIGGAAALIPADAPALRSLGDSPPGAGYRFSNRVGDLTGWGPTVGVVGGFYLLGRWQRDARAQTTGALGFRAVANTVILVETLKSFSRRPRPSRSNGLVNHGADGEFFTGGRAFPSGHSAQAWTLAVVVAHQYGHRRWVPPLAYGLAGFIAASRITARKHFPSDVFVGSMLGYMVGRHVVNSARSESARRWAVAPYTPPSGGAGLSLALQF